MAAAAVPEDGEFGVVASYSGEEDKERINEGNRSFGGKRWPKQETLALLKIRSDMDAAFSDSCLKRPLWEEVSRKLAELGYNRSAKKCKEKFENVYKYHKRTKDCRTGKSESKTYKFFDHLEALHNLHSNQNPSPPKPQTPMTTTIAALAPWTNTPASTTVPNINIVAKPINPTPIPQNIINPTNTNPNTVPYSFNSNISSNPFSTSSSSSTASEESGGRSKIRKRKWKDFFKRMTKEVIEKQEELQRKFLKAVEKQENERMMREESWRIQEMARINREHQILVQERCMVAAKDTAIIACLEKISGQQNANTLENLQVSLQQPPTVLQLPVPLQQQVQTLPPQPPSPSNVVNAVVSSPSRWPRAEVDALIKLRNGLDTKYQDEPKAPLWEEISAGMRRMGYNRSAKRCKEKWENINKYFKRMKESNKKRPEHSKTCPYFHQLDAIYREKSKNLMKPDNTTVPLLVRPERQWPPQPEPVGEDLDNERENDLNFDILRQGETEEEEDGGNGTNGSGKTKNGEAS
ncbi:hypothetical protein SLEP1_g4630 [Rubroshorea leprosula]|uniref:Myb-like domain-containing protein n=1 Tax=Rubroshorea leprosula TaxID=152421 RepID=A0AAV5HPR9_9ROSI|nr:hypothetical protein SLEP1_g4630 [Rubroshorea leprosula]